MKIVDYVNEQFDIELADDYIIVSESWDASFILTTVSNSLCNYFKLYQLGVVDNNFKLAIITNSDVENKFKEEDPETNLQRMKIIINQFDISDLNFSCTIFTDENDLPFRSAEVSTGVWPFKNKWIGDKKQIMIRTYSSTDNVESTTRRFGHRIRNTDMSFYRTYAENHGLTVIEYGYETPFETMIENMIHSKFVVSDFSGLSIFSMFMDAPTLIVTEKKTEMYFCGQYKPVTFGIGNLTLHEGLDYIIDGKIVQIPFQGKVYSIAENESQVPDFN
jgi:hypothetical protein